MMDKTEAIKDLLPRIQSTIELDMFGHWETIINGRVLVVKVEWKTQ